MEQKNMETIILEAGSDLEEYLDHLFDTLMLGSKEKTKTPNRVVITLDMSGPTSRCCFSPYGRDQTSTIDGEEIRDIVEAVQDEYGHMAWYCGEISKSYSRLEELHDKQFEIFDSLRTKLESA